MDDWDRARAWADGDTEAAAALIDAHQGRLYRFFRNKVSEPQTCSDLIQQTFLGMLESAARARPDHAFTTWLLGIARNTLYAHYRKRAKRGREDVDFSTACSNALEATTVSSIVARRREAQALVDALRDIAVDDQVLVELRFFEGASAREIGEALELARGSVDRRIKQALESLRAALVRRLADSGVSEVSDADLQRWVDEVRARY